MSQPTHHTQAVLSDLQSTFLHGTFKDINANNHVVAIDVASIESTEPQGSSTCNAGGNNVVAHIIQDFLSANVLQQDIAVVSMYCADKELIRAMLSDSNGAVFAPDVTVSTVDAFQGHEKAFVVGNMFSASQVDHDHRRDRKRTIGIVRE